MNVVILGSTATPEVHSPSEGIHDLRERGSDAQFIELKESGRPCPTYPKSQVRKTSSLERSCHRQCGICIPYVRLRIGRRVDPEILAAGGEIELCHQPDRPCVNPNRTYRSRPSFTRIVIKTVMIPVEDHANADARIGDARANNCDYREASIRR